MPNKPRFWLKAAAACLAAGILALGGAAVMLRRLLSPEKLQALAAENGRKYLDREVRFKDLSLGLARGLTMEGFELSERPDFAAGTFLKIESLNFRIRLAPLLSRRVVIDRVRLEGPELRIVLGKDGRLNFADLLETKTKTTASDNGKNDGPAEAGELPFSLAIREARLEGGRLVYRDIAGGAEWTVSTLEGKAESFSLREPFPVSLSLRAANRGGGRRIDAKLSLDGKADLSGAPAGRFAAELERLTAEVAGLEARISGSVRLAPEALELSGLKGELAGGLFTAKLKVRDYAGSPDIDFEADLSRLDLAKLLAANASTSPPPPPGPAAVSAGESSRPPPARPPGAGAPMKARGNVKIAEIEHPGAKASKAALSWDLRGITPDLGKLSGWAKLRVGEGRFSALGNMSEQSRILKVVLLPFTIIGKAASLGGIKLLPDLSAVSFSEIAGDYAFENGVLTIKESRLESPLSRVTASGSVNLPRETLALSVTAALANAVPIVLDVGGTFSEPKPRLRVDKLLTRPVGKLLQAPEQIFKASNLLKGLFKKKQ